MGKILEQIHAARIIHADVKPDNVMIVTRGISDSTDSLEQVFSTATIKIIDFGRAIDMQYAPKQEFIGRAGTKCFDCIEMISNMPWNYQTDFFGLDGNKIRPVKQIKRRLAMRSMWLDIFDSFLNIPDCKSLPSWPRFNSFIEEQLKSSIEAEPLEWKKGVERFNNYVKAR
uniref:Protein kinase domain-containing protein n=1 Tax=Ditylenchus dipsaci TaxID=166011 RepID=A0A915DFN7_9BILA